ncbi:MAG: hypothetical protein CYPHOPRED_002669 [Cyphobasidiales sp. Tagirdzhanova-0007]|nr:MAG: hypothetical protein CYPHOPRED_002669 [Cyphobasidiales sp. Tagirdzhanova-0007]
MATVDHGGAASSAFLHPRQAEPTSASPSAIFESSREHEERNKLEPENEEPVPDLVNVAHAAIGRHVAQNYMKTLYTRRHERTSSSEHVMRSMMETRRIADFGDSLWGSQTPVPVAPAAGSLRIWTVDPKLITGRPAFFRTGSMHSVATSAAASASCPTSASTTETAESASISSVEASEAETPNTSNTSSYSYSSNPQCSDLSFASFSAPNTAFTSHSSRERPLFIHLDLLSSSISAFRPPLLRSVSEDVVVHQRSEPLQFYPRPAPSGNPRDQKAVALPLTKRSLTADGARAASRLSAERTNGKANYRTQSAKLPSGCDTSTHDIETYLAAVPREPTTLNAGSQGLCTDNPGSGYEQYLYDRTDRPLSLPSTFDAATAEAIRQAAAAIRPSASGRALLGTGAWQSLESSNTSMALGFQGGIMGNCGNGYFGNAIRAKAVEIFQELLPACTCGGVDSGVVSIVEYASLSSLSASIVKPIITSLIRAQETHAGQMENNSSLSWSVTHVDTTGSDFRPIMRQIDNLSSDSSYLSIPSTNIFPSFVARPFSAQVAPPCSVSVGFSLMDLQSRRAPAAPGLSAAAAAHTDLHSFLNLRAVEFKRGGLLVLAFVHRGEDQLSPAMAVKATRAGDSEHVDTPRFTSPLTFMARPPAAQGVSASLSPLLGRSSGRTAAGAEKQDHCSMSVMTKVSPSSNNTLSSPAVSTAPPTPSPVGMSRSRSGSSPCTPSSAERDCARKNDLWSTLPTLLAPCIQRLVSTGLIKSDTANQLLALPLHPRTSKQTQAVLRLVRHHWKVEWSCGLIDAAMPDTPGVPSPSTPTSSSSIASGSTSRAVATTNLPLLAGGLKSAALSDAPRHTSAASSRPVSEEDPLSLSHPAYTAFQSTALSQVQYAEHALQFIRVLYEAHFRSVLKDHARLSRARLEEVLDTLNEVVREKLEEPGRATLPLEFEVCMFALRRL